MKKRLTLITCFMLGLSGFVMQAQQGAVASGGNATGSGGSASYSVGQVFYTANTGSNGSVSQGLQQVFDLIVPTFDPVAPICIGSPLANLPTTSTNGITGSWSPAMDNTTTTTYTFTPDDGQFADITTLTVVVNALPQTPVMGSNSPICATSNLDLTANAASYSMNGNSNVSFVDISGTGTSIGAISDDSTTPITLPSAFMYNGVPYTSALVSNNGVLVFGASSGYVYYDNSSLPQSGTGYQFSGLGDAGSTAICPFWDDLLPTGSSNIQTQLIGNKYIVQWTVEDNYNNAGVGTITFQVQLDMTTNQIHFVYQDVIFGDGFSDNGALATIGLNFSDTSALQYSYNSPSLVDGQSITFTPATLTYDWTGPNGFTSSNQNPSITGATIDASGTYTVTVTNTNTGCSTTNTVDAIVTATPVYFADTDGDGFGDANVTLESCTPVAGYVLDNTDCDDTNPAVHPGATEICYDGIDNNCDGTIDEGCTPIVTVVQSSQCGITLPLINSSIYANLVAGAQGYRFRVTDMSTMQVQTIDRALRVFQLTQLANYKFDTTYQVEVSVRKFNVWQPFYGSPCTVSTPATTTQVQSSQCGATLTAMNNVIYANNVPYATGYRFRATNLLTSDVQVVDRPLRDFRMNLLVNPAYNATYTIEVAVRNTDGTYLPYGSVCNVTTPIFPTTSLQDSQCDYTATSNTETIYANSYSGATTYRFKFENVGLGYTYTFDRPLRSFSLSIVPGLMAGTTYSVQVSIELNGEFGPYGKVCSLTTPGMPARAIEKADTTAFKAIAYPNPYDNTFNLEVTTSTDEVIELRVYDMIGKLIEERKVDVSAINTIQLGDNYPTGIYNVIVSQESNTKTLLVIKR